MDYPRIKITNTEETYKKKKKSNHPQDTKKYKHLKQTIQRNISTVWVVFLWASHIILVVKFFPVNIR
jgi:hypothetical protein